VRVLLYAEAARAESGCFLDAHRKPTSGLQAILYGAYRRLASIESTLSGDAM